MGKQEGRRILVVDDEPCIADTLATILRSSGYDAVSFHDGKSALEASRFSAPDLLITDVTMPGMSGVELAILMRKLCPDCRILLFSGLSHSFDLVEEANRKGHNFVLLEKPIHPAELLKRVAATVPGDSPQQVHQRPA